MLSQVCHSWFNSLKCCVEPRNWKERELPWPMHTILKLGPIVHNFLTRQQKAVFNQLIYFRLYFG
jgi:hypothetical protein